MYSEHQINLLTALNLRRVNVLPPHFLPVYFILRGSEKDVVDWIAENLQGRFFVAHRVVISATGQPTILYCAAFEDHSESTYFSLAYISKSN